MPNDGPEKPENDGVVKSAGRVLAILEYFDEVQRPLNVKEIIQHFGYPESSTAVLLRSLVRLGFLRHDRSSRKYLPTARVARLGAWVSRRLMDDENVLRFLADVHAATGETILLGVQNDLQVEYIHVLEANRPLRYSIKTGTMRPVLRSGIGWALLSTQSDDAVRRLLARAAAARQGDESLDVDQVMQCIAETRAAGYAFSRHIVNRGVGVIAMPLPVDESGQQLAVGAGGPVERLEEHEKEIVQVMKAGIARWLSGRPSAGQDAA